MELVKIEKVETDGLLLRTDASKLRVKFADISLFTKEESADSLRPWQGKQAAIPVDGPFFIGVEFREGAVDGSLAVMPVYFAIASIERY